MILCLSKFHFRLWKYWYTCALSIINGRMKRAIDTKWCSNLTIVESIFMIIRSHGNFFAVNPELQFTHLTSVSVSAAKWLCTIKPGSWLLSPVWERMTMILSKDYICNTFQTTEWKINCILITNERWSWISFNFRVINKNLKHLKCLL